jgi:UDP-glucose 4-epimerase
LTVFGGAYPTPDGTCIRDYVHVTDLAEAHLLAFARLAEGSVTWNLGNGQGHSVLEVVRTAERVMGRAVPFSMSARRPGDPAALVASSDRIKREAGWAPAHAGLHHIIETAYRWRLAHPHGWRAG